MSDTPYTQYTRQRQLLTASEDAAELVFISELPSFEAPELEHFYALLAESCRDFCQRALIPTCTPAHSYVYRLRVRALPENEFLTLTLTATLSDKTARHTLRSATHTHVWRRLGDKGRFLLCRSKKNDAHQ